MKERINRTGLGGDLRYPTSREKRARYGAPGGCAEIEPKKRWLEDALVQNGTEIAAVAALGYPGD
jgi:hypothetical protein